MRCLTATGGLAAGETVLVLGAGGVVGQSAVQLARVAGAGHVVACARSDTALERARRLGADGTVRLEDGEDVTRLARRLGEAAGPVDLVIDPVCGLPAAAALRALRPGGRLVNLGSAAGEECAVPSAVLRSGSLHVRGYTNNALTAGERREALLAVVGHAMAGALTVGYERVPLDAAAEAWTRPGRIVLVP